ncbi:hypothetical protein H6P81_017057 [Aristolochia fimbriata]|uniref:Uncharacterized protein n=1 Tax=Aristolochia fimbriata TaxID=158543 RepID=A0AAV7DXA7_ARIFI|nr:hypothetical protein H6P81_017057 [Aristolochia fimbriata]
MGYFHRSHLRRICSLLPPMNVLLLIILITNALLVYGEEEKGHEGMRSSYRGSPPAPRANNHEHQTPETTTPANRKEEAESRHVTYAALTQNGPAAETVERDRPYGRRGGAVYNNYQPHVSNSKGAPPPPPFAYWKDQPFPLDPSPGSSSPP